MGLGRLSWKGLPGANTPASSTFSNYGCKKFCNIDTWSEEFEAALVVAVVTGLVGIDEGEVEGVLLAVGNLVPMS